MKDIRYSLNANPAFNEVLEDFPTFLDYCSDKNVRVGGVYFVFEVKDLFLSKFVYARGILNDILELSEIEGVNDCDDFFNNKDVEELQKLIGDFVDSKIQFETLGNPVKKYFTENDINRIKEY